MTTYEFVQTRRLSLAPAARSVARGLSGIVRRFRPLALPVAGFGLLTAAAASWEGWAGLVVAGLSCFALDYGAGKQAK